MNKAWAHFKTITKHKIVVMMECFKVGLYKQGLLHDLSKYMPVEFLTGAKYYQGTRSPNAAEKDVLGYSKAWLHHKGRNKHHYEYWTDMSMNKIEGIVGVKMPINYVVEMFMDRIAASKIYQGKDYTTGSAWEYYRSRKDYLVMHPDTRRMLEHLLLMLKNYGEKRTFVYIKNQVLTGKVNY